MQNVPPARKTLSPALKNGLIFGLIAGAIIIAFNLLDLFTHLSSILAITIAHDNISAYPTAKNLITFAHSLCDLFIIAVLCAFAGYRTKKTSTKTRSALLAGLWGGLTTTIMFICYALISLFFTFPQAINVLKTTSPTMNNGVIVLAIFILIFILIIGAVLNTSAGLAGGAIGGALVRRQPMPPFYQYPYPPQPYLQPYVPQQYPPQPYAQPYPPQTDAPQQYPPRPAAPQD